jgi:branched-chain amino acid transport system permease protein
MLGAFIAYTLVATFGKSPLGFWSGVILAALAVAVIGALIEISLLKRIYAAPELLQLVATFGVVLIVRDAAPCHLGRRGLAWSASPGFFPARSRSWAAPSLPYDLLLLVTGPLVLLGLWLLLTRTRFGVLVRAATENRVLTAALGIDQRRLYTAVFALGALCAGLAGALQLPREPANLGHGPRDHRRGVCRYRRGRPWIDSRRLCRRVVDRIDQGAVHRARQRRYRRNHESRFRN